MGYSKKEARKAREKVSVSDMVSTETLDATTTVEIVQLGVPADKVSWQSDGTLAGTVEVTINGVTWVASTAFTATVIGTYSASLVKALRITRTGGSGKLHILAK